MLDFWKEKVVLKKFCTYCGYYKFDVRTVTAWDSVLM